MNYLAHLYLARGDEALMLGGLLGDHIRGLRALRQFPPDIRAGIRLHRRIDRYTDQHRVVKKLRRAFPGEFRRYAGIIIDVAFDHQLARRWSEFSEVSLAAFDTQVRMQLARHPELVPEPLARFMAYADRRGLFAAYRIESEMLYSLAGIGTRLKRDNPLHRVSEVWPALKSQCAEGFDLFFPDAVRVVDYWRKRMSTSTGS